MAALRKPLGFGTTRQTAEFFGRVWLASRHIRGHLKVECCSLPIYPSPKLPLFTMLLRLSQ